MRKFRSILALAAIAAVAAPSLVAAGEDRDCLVPLTEWRPKADVAALAEQNGWSVRRIKIDDGCYAIYGADASGRPIEVVVNPATLEIVEFEYDDRRDEGRRSHDSHQEQSHD